MRSFDSSQRNREDEGTSQRLHLYQIQILVDIFAGKTSKRSGA
jgi:hypothetical protein